MLTLFGKKYKCDTCGAKFKSQSELMEHAKVHMQSPQTASFKCKVCGMSFQTESELKRHAESVHGIQVYS